ncbi:MAG: hypothetical protein RLZ25_694 [Pseudomonadota bacterium]
MRNPHRSRLGGVCAGLSDYTGLSQTLLRMLFLISLFFGGFGLWVYMILWIATPAQNNIPITDASLTLRWQLFQVGRKIAKLHRSQKPHLADQAQLAYDAIRRLAPKIDLEGGHTSDPDTARLALIEFPSLLDQIHRAGHLMSDASHDEHIHSLSLAFEATCNKLIDTSREALEPIGWRDPEAKLQEADVFSNRLHQLTSQLSIETSGATLARLQQLETHLNYLLQVPVDVLNDLGPIGAHEIHRIAFDFLPETLEAYLKIQGPLARSEPIREQKTAEEIFDEQLELLDATLVSYSKALHDRDAKSLLIQGHFLREKFATPSEDNFVTESRDPQP